MLVVWFTVRYFIEEGTSGVWVAIIYLVKQSYLLFDFLIIILESLLGVTGACLVLLCVYYYALSVLKGHCIMLLAALK